MTSVSSASSSNAAYLAMQKNLFSKSDSDSSGGLSEEEFVAARPKGVSETQATALYATLDSENTGSLTEDQFSSAMSKVFSGDDSPESRISSEAMDVLMQLQQQSGMMGMQQMSSSDIYSSMDSDGDGSVTQTEFVSARPDGMSEDDAEALYATIDTENAGSITEEQFTESLESAGAPMGPPPSGSAESDEETYDALDTNQDGVVSEAEFLASRPDDVSEEDAQTIYDMIDSEGTGSISVDQLSEFLGSTRQPPMGPPPGEAADLADATSSTDADYLVNLLSGTYAETEDSDLAA